MEQETRKKLNYYFSLSVYAFWLSLFTLKNVSDIYANMCVYMYVNMYIITFIKMYVEMVKWLNGIHTNLTSSRAVVDHVVQAACYTWAFEAPSAADKRPPVPRAAHIVCFCLVTTPVSAPNPSFVTSPQLTTFIKIIQLIFENNDSVILRKKHEHVRA